MLRLLLVLTLPWLAGAAPAAPAAASAAAAPPAAAAAACERAVQATLVEARGAAASAVFTAPTRTPAAVDAAAIALRGSGQLRTTSGSRSFSYSCSYDSTTGTVAGVVVRDASDRAPAARVVEPDLAHLSPTACESAAALALKRRWPGVANISFDSRTRQLSQSASDNASLRGQGTALPSLRDPATHFSYDCSIDPRNGRVLGLRLAD